MYPQGKKSGRRRHEAFQYEEAGRVQWKGYKMKVKIFADGADLVGIQRLAEDPQIKGFTTNPTLMRQAGIQDYLKFAEEVVGVVGDRPLSLEVFSDEFDEMRRQAMILANLGANVNVKIPVTNTRAQSSMGLVRELVAEGVRVNVTAVFTLRQVDAAVAALEGGPDSFISVFAGRIADAGVDPIPTMQKSLQAMSGTKHQLIWASPREVLNVVQADQIGCHIITVTHDLIKKFSSIGKDLDEFSLDTVKMFANDASAAGYVI